MKNLFLTLWLSLIAITSAFSKNINENDALSLAFQWNSQNSGENRSLMMQIPVLQETFYSYDNPTFHVIKVGNSLVFISGDDRTKKILGWTDNDQLFEKDIFETGFTLIKNSWEGQISQYREDNYGLENEDRSSIMLDQPQQAEVLQPLIKSCWGQGSGWNEFCPSDANNSTGHTYVGCVAVSLAQILYYYNYPWRGRGFNSYLHPRYGQISESFIDYNPNWLMMNPTTPTSEAAKLLYLCGVAVRMDYGVNGSSANTGMTATALNNYFRFKTSKIVYRSSFSEAKWDSLVRNEILQKRPLIYRGQSSQGGHAFNIDGYRSDGYYHINFGWNCNYNGWYSLNSITPGNYNFAIGQACIIDVVQKKEELLLPRDGDKNVSYSKILFKWILPSDITILSSKLEISTNEQMTNPIITQTINITSSTPSFGYKNKNILQPNTKYYWRITNFDKSNRWYISQVNSFTTAPKLAILKL